MQDVKRFLRGVKSYLDCFTSLVEVFLATLELFKHFFVVNVRFKNFLAVKVVCEGSVSKTALLNNKVASAKKVFTVVVPKLHLGTPCSVTFS